MEPLQAIDGKLPVGCLSEEYCEISPGKYESLDVLANMSKEDHDRLKPRHVIRYLNGSFVLFHKDSIYNHLISQYRGEHNGFMPNDFRNAIEMLANKFMGETIKSLMEKRKAQEMQDGKQER